MRDPDEEVAHAITAIGDEAIARRLVSAYGTAWHGVWSLTEADPALASFVESGLPYVYAELLHAITHEQAATLGDLLIRRTPIAFETRDHGRSAARRIAPVVGRWMRWSGMEVDDAIEAYDAESERMFRVVAEPAGYRSSGRRSWIVLSSVTFSCRVSAGSLRYAISPTDLPSSARPMGDDIVTCPSSKSTASPKTRW